MLATPTSQPLITEPACVCGGVGWGWGGLGVGVTKGKGVVGKQGKCQYRCVSSSRGCAGSGCASATEDPSSNCHCRNHTWLGTRKHICTRRNNGKQPPVPGEYVGQACCCCCCYCCCYGAGDAINLCLLTRMCTGPLPLPPPPHLCPVQRRRACPCPCCCQTWCRL
jgi:hypothetical protein